VREDDRLPVAPVPPPPEDRANPNANPTVRPANSPAVAPTRDPGRGPSALGPEAGAEPLPALAHTPLGGTSSARDPRSTAAYEAALADARGGQCARAVDAFAAFLVRWPDHPHAASALYWRGECVLAGGDARRAAEQFEAALARSTTSHLSASAVFKLAQCHRRLGDAARARSYSERLQREFAATEPAARARAEEIR
jgi:TolA-binding protein